MGERVFEKLAFVVLTASICAFSASGLEIGYYDMGPGSGSNTQQPPILAAGHTPVRMTTLTAAELATVDVLFVQNRLTGGYGAEYLSRLGEIQTAVAAGLVLVLHDEFVAIKDGSGSAATILPGGSGFTIRRNFDDPDNLEIRDPATVVTTGAAGILTNTSLDGAQSSSHGYTLAGSLPAGARLILSRTNPAEIVTFSYHHGCGTVIYSTIPLGQLLADTASGPPRSTFRTVYAPNVVQYAAGFVGSVPDLALSFGDGRTTAVPGTAVRYNLETRNLGPCGDTGAHVTASFDPAIQGLQWTCTASGGAVCPAATGVGNVDAMVDFPALGSALTFVATGTVRSSAGLAATTLVSNAAVTPGGGADPIASNNTATDTDTLVPTADLEVKKSGPGRADPGDTASYTVTVRNHGPSDAGGVLLSDPTPIGLGLVSAGSPCTGGFSAPCSLGNLAAGTERSVAIALGVPVPYLGPAPIFELAAAWGDFVDPDPADNFAPARTALAIPAQADLALALAAPPSAKVGSTLTYRAMVSNLGPVDAEGVTVTGAIPAGLFFVATPDCPELPCALGRVPAGASRRVEIRLGVTAGAANPTPWSATAAASTPDPTPGNNTAIASTPVGADTYDLTVELAAPARVEPGARLTVIATVRNRGPAAATGVSLRDVVPAGLGAISVCNPTACPLGDLAAGASTTHDLVYQVPAGAAPLALIPSTATATASAAPGVVVEADTSDDTGNAVSAVAADAVDLELELRGPASVAAGERLRATLAVTNRGPGTAHAVQLTLVFPGAVSFAAATAPCAGGFPCALGDLKPGAVRLIGVELALPASYLGPNPVGVQAALTSHPTLDRDVDSGDSARTLSTAVATIADLTVAKTDNLLAAAPGQEITWTITIQNRGPSSIVGATVSDTFPAQLDPAVGVSWTCAATAGGLCAAAGNGNLAETVTLPAGSTLTYTARGRLNPALTPSGQITNDVTVTLPVAASDPLPADNTATDTMAFVAAADLAVTVAGPAQAVPGTSLVVNVGVANTGGGTAASVVLALTPPPGLPVPTLSGACNALPCTLGTLAAGANTSVSFRWIVPSGYAGPEPIVVAVSATTTSPELDLGDNSASASVPIMRRADLAITKTDDATELIPGQPVRYAIVATNLGPSDALGSVVSDIPPAVLLDPSWSCVALGGAVCSTPTGDGTIATTVDLPVGSAVTFLLDATLDPMAASAVVNQATITPAPGITDPGPAPNSALDQSGIRRTADLGVTAIRDRAEAVPGEPIIYQLGIENHGPSDAVGATFTATPPAALLGATWTCTGFSGAVCPRANGVGAIAETLDLPAGGRLGYALAGTLDPAATGLVRAGAGSTVPSGLADPVPGNDNAIDETTLVRVADVGVSLIGPPMAQRGAALLYDGSVANAGPSAAAVTLTDPTPPGLTFTGLSLVGCETGFPCTLALGAGETLTFALRYEVPAGYSGPDPIVDVLAARSDARDRDPADNRVRTATPVGRAPSADLRLSKTAPAVAAIGSTVRYTLEVENLGPDDAPAVVLAESTPAGLVLVERPGERCGNGFDCALGTVHAGEKVTVEALFNVTAGAAATVVNNAQVSSTATDLAPADNSAQAQTTLIADPVDLVATLAGPLAARPGDAPSWRLAVHNRGPAAAANVRLTAPAPTGLSFGAATAPCQSGFTPACFLGTLAAGATVELEARFLIPLDYTGPNPIALQIAATADPIDVHPADNTARWLTGVSVDGSAEAADLEVVKTGPGSALAGQPLDYLLVVRNLGPGKARDVVLADPTPAGTGQPASTAPCPAFPCALGELQAGSAVAVRYTAVSNPALAAGTVVTNTAQLASGSPDPAAGNASSAVATQLGVAADLSITKTNNATSLVPGAPVTYTLEVRNHGPSHASEALVSDDFPPELLNVSWTCTATTGSSCAPGAAGNGDLARTVSIAAGGTVTYTVTAQVDPAATGSLSNTATVTAPAGVPDPVTGNDTATDTDPLTPTADVGVALTSPAPDAVPGTDVTYRLVVSNPGPSRATAVTVHDDFPAELANVVWSCQPSGGAVCTAGGVGDLVDTLPSLPPGASATYTAIGRLSPSAAQPLVDRAIVDLPAGIVDPNPGNQSASLTLPLRRVADLEVIKTNGVIAVVPGTPTTWTIVVHNLGPGDVTGARLLDSFPAAVSGVTWTCAGAAGGCPAPTGNGNLDAILGTLAPGASVTFEITAQVSPAATGLLENHAAVSPPAGVADPQPANNTATDGDPLTPVSDLAITKTPVGPVVAGMPVSYAIVVSNTGPSNTSAIAVQDLLPAVLTGAQWFCTASAGGSCGSGTGNLVDLANLPGGATATYALTANLAATATNLRNTATATPAAGTTDPDPANNHATSEVVPAVVTDLAITKTDGRTTVVQGKPLVYEIMVGNLGPSQANGVQVIDTFPAALTGVQWTCTAESGASCAPAGAGNLDTSARLSVGTQVRYRATATVAPTATPGPLVNTATVTAAAGASDPVPGNSSASDTTQILARKIFDDGFESGNFSAWSRVVP